MELGSAGSRCAYPWPAKLMISPSRQNQIRSSSSRSPQFTSADGPSSIGNSLCRIDNSRNELAGGFDLCPARTTISYNDMLEHCYSSFPKLVESLYTSYLMDR